MAYLSVSLINLYLHTKFRSNRKNILWMDGRTYGQTNTMHRLSYGINSLLHSVILILFTVLLVHLILRTSPHQSPPSLSPSLPRPFTSDVKIACCLKSPHPTVFLVPFGVWTAFDLGFGPNLFGTGVCLFQFLLFIHFLFFGYEC